MSADSPAADPTQKMAAITDQLVADLKTLRFADPVTHIYNPLRYARSGYDAYLSRYGATTRPILLLGMNPGPFGMVQTGVPFGDVSMVRQWMGIQADIGQPQRPHPKRPVAGFDCTRKEVSGQRVWQWARKRYGKPEAFFSRFLVLNYCPLVFMEASGRNRTPDKLPVAERKKLFGICDNALQQAAAIYAPQWVIGIGAFAELRAQAALAECDLNIGRIIHPSPANPRANQGWADIVEAQLSELGIDL